AGQAGWSFENPRSGLKSRAQREDHSMLHHVSVGVANVEAAARFYDSVLGALGYRRVMEFLPYAIGYGEAVPEFWVQLTDDQRPDQCAGAQELMEKAVRRCDWPGEDPLYISYHDEEWGVPEYDDRALYEKLVLDGFQAGLSWITILRKRENFRRAFDGFDPEKIARYTPKKIERLMQDAGIVRNRAKIEGAVLSAR